MQLQEYLEEIRDYEVCNLATIMIKLDYPCLYKFLVPWITAEVVWCIYIYWLFDILSEFLDHIKLMLCCFLCFELLFLVKKLFCFVFVDICSLLENAPSRSIGRSSGCIFRISS